MAEKGAAGGRARYSAGSDGVAKKRRATAQIGYEMERKEMERRGADENRAERDLQSKDMRGNVLAKIDPSWDELRGSRRERHSEGRELDSSEGQ